MLSIPLEPEQIRIIREGLGLSQREAGQVLGGGPNAFAKYESGSLAPAAALANLLLVLKDNPGALGALQPDRAPVPVRLLLPFEESSKPEVTMTNSRLVFNGNVTPGKPGKHWKKNYRPK